MNRAHVVENGDPAWADAGVHRSQFPLEGPGTYPSRPGTVGDLPHKRVRPSGAEEQVGATPQDRAGGGVMRILVVMGSDHLARSEACRNSSREVAVRMNPSVVVRKGDTEVHYRPIQSAHDAQMFRGQWFDLIIEDCSFNPDRTPSKRDWLYELQATVLR